MAGVVLGSGVFILNREVSTKQGINYHVYTRKIPVYLKLLDLYDRHYNYRYLVRKLVDKNDSYRQKAIKLLAWSYQNIYTQPKELPVIDDHVWHIIVRGYGTAEQFSDVFSTLCNYAGMPAFFSYVHSQSKETITFSFVRIGDGIFVFDAYRGIYFETDSGELASTEDILAGNWKPKNIAPLKNTPVEYLEYFKNMPVDMLKYSSLRPQIQSPWQRFVFEFSKLFRNNAKRKYYRLTRGYFDF